MALINPQTGASSSIYDPALPSRIVQGQQPPPQPPIATTAPGQGPQYNPSFGADTSPEAMGSAPPAPLLTAAPAPQNPFMTPNTGSFKPSFNANAPGISSILAAQSAKGNYLNRSLGNVDARGAPYPMHSAAGPATGAGAGTGLDLTDNTFKGLTDEMVMGGNAPQTAQAPQSATPQGWNLFAALGQALGHLLGFNAQGQPQGMSGLIRNPVQAAPTQTAALRMPTPSPAQQVAPRYQGRTLVG